MSWKTIVVKSNQKIYLKNNLLTLENMDKNEVVKFSLEDISCIFIENLYTNITTAILAKISAANIFLIICDEFHDPTGIFLSYNNHWKPLEVFELQNKISNDLKEILWKKIIEQKILNSLNVLHIVGADHTALVKMESYAYNVALNDKTNREAMAAKVFFKQLYGLSFIRFSDDLINSALNYGYKIIASCISRTLVKYGFNCFIGLFHRGKMNNWNLSYDLIEPFRPLVDLWVRLNIESFNGDKLNYNQRYELINLLNQNILIDDKIYTVNGAIEILIKSLYTTLKSNDFSKFKLPTIVEFQELMNDEQV